MSTETHAKLAKALHDAIQNDVKISKLLIIVDGLLDTLTESVIVLETHEHNDHALKSLRVHTMSVIDDTNEKLIGLNAQPVVSVACVK